MVTYTGSGKITDSDYHTVKVVGKTKSDNAVTITLNNAINLGGIDLSMVEKDDTVAELTFTGTYDNTDATSNSTDETWKIEIEGTETFESGNILIGSAICTIDETTVALCRGGATFTVDREYRRINADGDRGAVKGRIVMEGSEATITMRALTFLNMLESAYPGIVVDE